MDRNGVAFQSSPIQFFRDLIAANPDLKVEVWHVFNPEDKLSHANGNEKTWSNIATFHQDSLA